MSGSRLNVPAGYNDMHRLFLQEFMKQRMLTSQEAFQLFSAAYKRVHENGTPLQQGMEQAITLINRAIKGMKMEIRMITDEVTKQKYHAFIPTMTTSTGRLFVRYTAAELEFFKRIITEILNTEDRRISSTFCLNLNSSLPGNISKSDLEKLVKKMCDDKWLIHKDGKIRLSPLAIAELEPMLRETYKDHITICTLCNHIVLQGTFCENCTSVFHSHCSSRYKRTYGSKDYPCPTCNQKIADSGDTMDIDD